MSWIGSRLTASCLKLDLSVALFPTICTRKQRPLHHHLHYGTVTFWWLIMLAFTLQSHPPPLSTAHYHNTHFSNQIMRHNRPQSSPLIMIGSSSPILPLFVNHPSKYLREDDREFKDRRSGPLGQIHPPNITLHLYGESSTHNHMRRHTSKSS